MVLTRGSDQMAVSTKFDMREDDNVIRNYGRMLIELSSAIPDGIVSFFVSYSYMDKIISKWNEMGILQVFPPFSLCQLEQNCKCCIHLIRLRDFLLCYCSQGWSGVKELVVEILGICAKMADSGVASRITSFSLISLIYPANKMQAYQLTTVSVEAAVS